MSTNEFNFCPYCGTKLDADAKFCKNCGKSTKEEGKIDSQSQVDNSLSTPSNTANDDSTKRQTVYEGKIHKCPNCGEKIDSFQAKCKVCGFEIRGENRDSSVKELSIKLSNANTIEQKDDLIRTYYIPNTKEDICEFIILAISNIKSNDDVYEAWNAKLEQAYQKAKLSFGNEREFIEIDKLYKETIKGNAKRFIFEKIILTKKFACVFSILIGIFLVLLGKFNGANLDDYGSSPFNAVEYIGIMLTIVSFILTMLVFTSDEDKKQNNKNDDDLEE